MKNIQIYVILPFFYKNLSCPVFVFLLLSIRFSAVLFILIYCISVKDSCIPSLIDISCIDLFCKRDKWLSRIPRSFSDYQLSRKSISNISDISTSKPMLS